MATLYPTAVYLPPETTSATYDEDVNPTSVELEIFAPYGISYNYNAAATPQYSAALNYTGFTADNNRITQGLNLSAIPKVINLDTTDDEITIGLSIILQSLYFAGYRVASAGKIVTPKGSIVAEEFQHFVICMRIQTGVIMSDCNKQNLSYRYFRCK